jgi:hypothetical protein
MPTQEASLRRWAREEDERLGLALSGAKHAEAQRGGGAFTALPPGESKGAAEINKMTPTPTPTQGQQQKQLHKRAQSRPRATAPSAGAGTGKAESTARRPRLAQTVRIWVYARAVPAGPAHFYGC